MTVEEHSAFAQALELVLGKVDGTVVIPARTLEEGPCSKTTSLST